MTAKDVATLCEHFSQFEPKELHVFRRLFLQVPPSFHREHTENVVSEMYNALLHICPVEQRLFGMATLYCVLIPHNILPAWQVYLLNTAADLGFECQTLFERLEAALCVSGYNTVKKWYCNFGMFYACLLIDDEESLLSGHKVVCIAMWSGLPLMAVRTVEASTERRFRVGLSVALAGDPFKHIGVIHNDLHDAFRAGRTLVTPLCDHLSQGQWHGYLSREALSKEDQPLQ